MIFIPKKKVIGESNRFRFFRNNRRGNRNRGRREPWGFPLDTRASFRWGRESQPIRRGSLIEQYSAWEHAWDDQEQHGQSSGWNATKCKLLKNGVWDPAHATWWPPSGRAPRVLRPVLGFSGHSPDTLIFWKKSYVGLPFCFGLKQQRECWSRTARGAPLVRVGHVDVWIPGSLRHKWIWERFWHHCLWHFFFATHSSPNQDDYGGIGSILSKVGVLKMPDKTRECSLVEFWSLNIPFKFATMVRKGQKTAVRAREPWFRQCWIDLQNVS